MTRAAVLVALLATLSLAAPALGQETGEAEPVDEAGQAPAVGEAPVDPEAAPEAPEPAPTAPPAPAASRFVLLFTSDNAGLLVDAPCGRDPADEQALLPRVAAAAETLGAGDPAREPLLLDAGGGVFPSPLVNELGADPAGAAELARLLRRAGYGAMVAGEAALRAPTAPLLGLLRAARAEGLPFVASSLGCPDDAPEGCRQAAGGLVDATTIVDRGGLRVGVLALLPESVQHVMRSASRSGASVSPPVEAAREAVRSLRRSGVDLVVLVSRLDTEQTAPRVTLDLLGQLEGSDRPDLVIAASTAGVVTAMVAPGGGPAVLATEPGTLGRAVLERHDGSWMLVDAGQEALPERGSDELAGAVSAMRSRFCASHAGPLARGGLAAELDRDAFAGLVLRALREQTRAEVAVIDRGAVSRYAGFPMSGRLSAEQVARAIPNDTEVVVATVRGSALAKLAGAALDSDRAYTAGLARDGGAIKVNGRALNPDGTYRVVTTRYVAGGGDAIFEADAARFRPADPLESGESQLVGRVLDYLESGRPDEPYDPADELDLQRRPLWYGSLVLNASVSDSSIWNAASYAQAQLARQSVFDVRGDAELRTGFATRDHGWDNHLVLRYGRQRIETEAGSREYTWGESADLVRFRSAYTFDYVRNAVLDGAWYGPGIFLEYRLESEFYHEQTAEDDDSPHFLEMTGLLGLKLTPLPWMLFQAAGGVRSVLLVRDPYPLPGLSLRLEVLRRRLLERDDFPLFVSAVADYFLGWPVAVPDSAGALPSEGSMIHKFSLEGTLEFQIYGPLALTATGRVFLYDEDTGPLAVAVDASLGLRVALSGHLQDF